MSYENKPGTGALFKQDKKSEKAPDYKGPLYESIDGDVVEREIAAWFRKSKSGMTYLSVKVGDKFVPTKREQPTEIERPAQPDYDDQIPF